jgi:hypothetical protein
VDGEVGISDAWEVAEVPDFKNGATKLTEETKKKLRSRGRPAKLTSVSFVDSVTPFLRSGPFESARRLDFTEVSK